MTSLGVMVAGLGFAEFLTHGAVLDALHLHGVELEAGDFRSNCCSLAL